MFSINKISSKNIHKYIVLALTIITTSLVAAQEIEVRSFSPIEEIMIKPMQRLDANGEICALVKVFVPDSQASFEGSLIGDCDYKTSEYWCYLSPGSKQLKVKYTGCEPLMVDFKGGLQSKRIYELKLSIPDKTHGNTFTINGKINIVPLKGSDFGLGGMTFPALLEEREYPKGIRIYHNLKDGKYTSVLDSKALGQIKEDGSLNGRAMETLLGDITDEVLMKSTIPFSFSNVRIGDTFTVMCDEDDYIAKTIEITNDRISNGEYDLDFIQLRSNLSGYLVDQFTQQPLRNLRLRVVSLSNGNCFITESNEHGYFKVPSAFNDESFEIYFDNENTCIPFVYFKGSICDRFISVKRGMRISGPAGWDIKTDDGNEVESIRFGSGYYRETWTTYPKDDSKKGITLTRKGYPTIHINGIFPGTIDLYDYKKGKSDYIYEYNSDGTILSRRRN